MFVSHCSLQASDEDQVLLCCLQSSLSVLEKSHPVVQACFSERCGSAVASICQVCDEDRLFVFCCCGLYFISRPCWWCEL